MGALAVVEEPVEVGGDVGVAGFAADAADDLAVGVEDDGGGKDVAEVETVRECRCRRRSRRGG